MPVNRKRARDLMEKAVQQARNQFLVDLEFAIGGQAPGIVQSLEAFVRAVAAQQLVAGFLSEDEPR